uniref:Uncharacterized protein n=1 Tax=Panagrolaimus sp. ES5 TaxID=591445 RepID=A0AC34FXM1_9BILA
MEEVIRNEFKDFLPYMRFVNKHIHWFMGFICLKPFLISVSDLLKIFPYNFGNETNNFLTVAYQLAENQMKNKYKFATENTLKSAINGELTEFLERMAFSEMTFDFIKGFMGI